MTFIVDSSSYQPLTNSTSINNGIIWDDEEFIIPIGFTFNYFGVSFDSVFVSDYLSFNNNNSHTINPMNVDFMDRGSTSSLSPISYTLTGDIGKQILTIEWSNVGFYCENQGQIPSNDFANVQCLLYEQTGDIEIHIGPNQILLPDSSYCGNEGPFFEFTTPSEVYSLSGNANTPVVIPFSGPLSTTPSANTLYRFLYCMNTTASFEYSDNDSGLVSFQPNSVDYLTSFWDFGDGTQSTDESPTHHYDSVDTYTVTHFASGNCNNDTAFATVEFSITGIPLKESINLQLYPNPFVDYLSIKSNLNKPTNIEITSLQGILIHAQYIRKEELVNLSFLKPGTYIITIFNDDYSTQKAIIKSL